MSDLIDKLKQTLQIADVIGKYTPLKAAGRGFVGVDHDSLTVNPERGCWSWFSQTPGEGQKVLGGDLFSWIAHHKFGRVHVDGDQFVEVLREACGLAGLDFDAETKGRDGDHAKAIWAEKRAREETLQRFVEVAEAARTAEFYVRAAQIGANKNPPQPKKYLTKECIERWRIGCAPTLKQCQDAGLSEKDLRGLGLLCDPQREGPDEKSYMFFRDSLVIPFFEYGRCVFLASRYLSDFDWQGKPRAKKTLMMRSPSKANGWTGMARPAGFNLDALRGSAEVMLVEAPLDAVAATEAGHPAIAMLGGFPSPELVKKLKAAR